MNETLLGLECGDWIRYGRAPRGEITRERRYQEEHQRHSCECREVEWVDVKQKALDRLSRSRGQKQADRDGENRKRQSFTDHHADERRSLSAERQPDPHLAGTPLHGIRPVSY